MGQGEEVRAVSAVDELLLILEVERHEALNTRTLLRETLVELDRYKLAHAWFVGEDWHSNADYPNNCRHCGQRLCGGGKYGDPPLEHAKDCEWVKAKELRL